jgi:hypothetical protein
LFKTAVVSLLSISKVDAATDAYKYGYISNGADWPLIKAKGTECASKCQSPIDLRTEMNSHPYQ